jgi:hypothetical protein
VVIDLRPAKQTDRGEIKLGRRFLLDAIPYEELKIQE